MRVVALVLAALLAAPALAAPVVVYCEVETRRVLGVVPRGAERPPLAGQHVAIEHRDSADRDLLALRDAGVPVALWRCSPDLSEVLRMTPEEASLLAEPGAEVKRQARDRIDRDLALRAVVRELVVAVCEVRGGTATQQQACRQTLRDRIATAITEAAPEEDVP